MRRHLVLVTFVSLALLLSGCALFGSSKRSSGIVFSASGQVFSTSTGSPLSGVSVTTAGKVSVTDSDGRYSFSNVEANGSSASIVASKSGYTNASAQFSIQNGSSLVHNFYLTPSSALSGDRTVAGRVDFAASETQPLSLADPQEKYHPTDPGKPESVVVYSTDPVTEASAVMIAEATGASRYQFYDGLDFVVLWPPAGTSVIEFMEHLLSHPKVMSAEPNAPLSLTATPNDPLWSNNSSEHQLVFLPKAWDVSTGSNSVVVAVLDTGIREDHPDLAGRVVTGYDYYENDAEPTDPGAPGSTTASHGTHVAGIIGAVANNGMGTAGVSWNVRLLNVRVMSNNGDGDTSQLAAAIHYAVNQGADVINLSLGFTEDATPVRDAVDYAVSRGVILVAAAGNSTNGNAPIMYPARYPNVIAVGSVDEDTNKSSFSNVGPELDLLAPGRSILSTNYNRSTSSYDYQTMTGTSMATPHVSGIVALMLANGRSPFDIPEILRSTTTMTVIQNQRTDDRGYGIVNAYAAVTSALPTKARIFLINNGNQVVSPVKYPSLDRSFAFTDIVSSANLEMIGWIDVDNSNSLTRGDMTAVHPLSTAGGNVYAIRMPLDVHRYHSYGTASRIADALALIGVRED